MAHRYIVMYTLAGNGGPWWVVFRMQRKMHKVSNGLVACRGQFVGRLLPFSQLPPAPLPLPSSTDVLVFRFLIKEFCCLLLTLQFRSSVAHLAANLKTFLIS